jgi:copper chaperone NosL
VTRALLIASLCAASCAGATARPGEIALGQDACTQCRMVIVSQATAAQVAAPGEEPRFFDEIGCLRDYLSAVAVPPDAIAFVADHRTSAWVDARDAVFTRTSVSTPMTSGLLAHADEASRDGDPAARQGHPVAARAILGSHARSDTP